MTDFNANILVVDGFHEHDGDWLSKQSLDDAGFAHVDEKETDHNYDDPDAVCQANVDISDADLVYSWGLDSLLHLPTKKPKSLGISVLGVQNPCYVGQPIIVPANYKRFIALQIDEAFPRSGDVKGAAWVDITDPDIDAKIDAAFAVGEQAVNVNCRPLWGHLVDGVEMHTRTMNLPQVLAFNVRMMKAYAGAASSVQPSLNTTGVSP